MTSLSVAGRVHTKNVWGRLFSFYKFLLKTKRTVQGNFSTFWFHLILLYNQSFIMIPHFTLSTHSTLHFSYSFITPWKRMCLCFHTEVFFSQAAVICCYTLRTSLFFDCVNSKCLKWSLCIMGLKLLEFVELCVYNIKICMFFVCY